MNWKPMDKRSLRWTTIVAPLLFLTGILIFANFIVSGDLSFLQILIVFIGILFFVVLFSNWVFDIVDKREAEVQKRANQLESLNSAALTLVTELDVSVVLQKVVELSCKLINTRYGALGVLGNSGQNFEQIISFGLDEIEEIKIGAPPIGEGLFRLITKNEETTIINDVLSHPMAAGFPEHHPIMKTLLGVPIKTMDKVIGDLYLSEKIDEDGSIIDFTEEDGFILVMFATQAAIAIENARLYRQVQQLAVLEERQRFGMDLHDGIIQSIYAVGLMLEDIKHHVANDPKESIDRIGKSIVSLNTVISDLRNYILDLRPHHFQGKDIAQGIQELARALRANTLMNVRIDTSQVNSVNLSPEKTVEILHIAQEALTNVQKHARATAVEILLFTEKEAGQLKLEIKDNGQSILDDHLQRSPGNGLNNMRERTANLNGELTIQSRKLGGTRVLLVVPINKKSS